MMSYIIGVPTLLLLAVLQSTVFSQIGFLDGQPDLILVILIAWSLAGRADEAMVFALIGGVFLDLLSGTPFGATSIIYVAALYMISLVEGKFWKGHFLLPPAITLFTSLVIYAYSLGVLFLIGHQVDLSYALARVILPGTFINLLLALPAYHLMSNFQERYFPSEVDI
ncbi:MAG: rod shape-determining protein MreD [Anaerolineales bacterium]|nr:rod shape-determining protein MreD [Anaerolineales bacterium]